jgi:preprotein translocase subunit YajC
MFLMFVPLILLLFWQTRSQQKKQEQAVAGLKKGDRVVTQSGLIGRLLEIDQRYAKLELAPGVKVSVLRSSLAGRDSEDSAKGGDTKGADTKGADAKSGDAKGGDKADKEKKSK